MHLSEISRALRPELIDDCTNGYRCEHRDSKRENRLQRDESFIYACNVSREPVESLIFLDIMEDTAEH